MIGCLEQWKGLISIYPHPTSPPPLNHETSAAPFASASPPPPFCLLLKYLVFSSLCISATSKPRPECSFTAFIYLVIEYFLQTRLGLLLVIAINQQVAPLQKMSIYAITLTFCVIVSLCSHHFCSRQHKGPCDRTIPDETVLMRRLCCCMLDLQAKRKRWKGRIKNTW